MPRTGHAILASLALSIASAASAQLGPINPPAGVVGDTGPDLSQIDGRTPLSAQNTPGDFDSVFRISRPGSYYLTADLTVPAGDRGIEIAISEVSIDLNGYTIRGLNGSLEAIGVVGSGDRVRVSGGTVRGTAGGMFLRSDFVVEDMIIEAMQGDGVRGTFLGIVRSCRFDDIDGADAHGVSVNCCAEVVGCRFASSTTTAAMIEGTQNVNVQGCWFNNLRGPAIQVSNECIVAGNSVEFTSFSLPASSAVVIVANRAMVRGNSIEANSNTNTSVNGILATGTQNRIEDNHITGGRIQSTGSDNVIIGNTMDTAISATASDFVGPSITSPAQMTTASRFANIIF
ncbi:MAG: right-handed parallel beta-helix repeat-containing protein [Planctomycetota bacterium]